MNLILPLLDGNILNFFASYADTLCFKTLFLKLIGLELFGEDLEARLLYIVELESKGLTGINMEYFAALWSKEVVAVHDELQDRGIKL